MTQHFDKCEANQMANCNDQAADASARLSKEVNCDPRANCEPQAVKPAHEAHHGKFHGLNLGIIKIGYNDHGSLALGVNIGIAKVGTQIGLENRVDAGLNLGPIGGRAGVGLGINKHGLHSDVGARAHVAKIVDTGAQVGAKLGPQSGVHADTGAKVLGLHTRHTFNSDMGDEGFNNAYKGDVGLAKVVGVKAGAHANLNDDSSFGGHAHTNLGDAKLGAGVDINTKNNSAIKPDVYVDADSGEEKARFDVGAQVGPKLDVKVGTGYDTTDRYADRRGGELSLGVGQSGIGGQAVETHNGRRKVAKAGWGPDYMADF
ncbi:MAG: hypothetical protein JST01_18275 [Cyanobacteria bacterium SZAS TMP-1]|nr:hypothetical protein [Cyanobacteria bacterium SZAS TMP-1]